MNSYLLLFCLKNAQLKVVQSIILLKSISPLFWATNLHWRNLKWKLFNDIEAKSCYCQRHDRGFPLYIVVRHIGPTNVEFKGSSSTRVHSGRLLLFVCLFVFCFFFLVIWENHSRPWRCPVWKDASWTVCWLFDMYQRDTFYQREFENQGFFLLFPKSDRQ